MTTKNEIRNKSGSVNDGITPCQHLRPSSVRELMSSNLFSPVMMMEKRNRAENRNSDKKDHPIAWPTVMDLAFPVIFKYFLDGKEKESSRMTYLQFGLACLSCHS